LALARRHFLVIAALSAGVNLTIFIAETICAYTTLL
jgi:hypothetical protein